jgi:type IV secretion system protein VirD4
MPTDVMGSAAWNNFLGHDAKYLSAKCNLLLGRPVFPGSLEPVYGKLLFRRPGHMLSIAQSGSGKGVSLIIPNLLSYMGSMLVIDPKGENSWITAKWRREGLGNKVYILDPWGEVNKSYGAPAGELETIASLNPLSFLEPKAADDPAALGYIGDVTYFADALVVTNPEAKEPHWDASAKELVAGLIAYVAEKQDIDPRKKTLKLVRALLNLPFDTLRTICGQVVEAAPNSVAAMKLSRFVKDTSEASGVHVTAKTQTRFLDTMPEQETSDFSFDELATGRTTIYLVIPATELQENGRWLRLMVSMAIRAVARIRASLDLPVLFMLDEFGTVGRLDVVENAYGLMRGFGIAVWAFLQDLSQLQRDYPKSWRTFVQNSTAMTSYGVMDDATADYISKMLGTQTVEYEARSTSTSKTSGTNWSQTGSSRSDGVSTSENISVNTTGRPLLFPDEIRRLRDDLCIVLGRHNPFLCRRLIYYEDYPFYRAARFDPTHFRSQEQQIQRGDAKTAKVLPYLARQQITSFESGKAALFPCGFEVERSRWGAITVRRGRRQLVKFRREEEFIPWAQQVLPEGYRRFGFVF